MDGRDAGDEATALGTQLGDTQSTGEAEYVYGLIARSTGDNGTAGAHFLRADSMAVERKDLVLQGEAAREHAVLYRHLGRNSRTLHRINQSHRVLSQLRARRELAAVVRRTSMLEGNFLEVARRWGESEEGTLMRRHTTAGVELWRTSHSRGMYAPSS